MSGEKTAHIRGKMGQKLKEKKSVNIKKLKIIFPALSKCILWDVDCINKGHSSAHWNKHYAMEPSAELRPNKSEKGDMWCCRMKHILQVQHNIT